MKQPINEIKRMQQLAGIVVENQADIYPPHESPDEINLYNRIASTLKKLINNISEELDIFPENIRISCDSLYEGSERPDKGLAVQIKASDNEWSKPWVGNNLIVQTPNKEGIVISASFGIKINGSKNGELRNIFNKANELDLDKYIADFNYELVSSLSSSERELIAPNTPIIVTGK